MPGYVGFQLAVELTNLFPVAKSVAAPLLTYARELRKSGSDIVVEDDLAETFGRVRINAELEAGFKNTVKINKIIPLMAGCPIELQSGPGPTMVGAFRDRRNMATVIQLSLLAWTHQREELANMLSICMRKRHEVNFPGAIADPGYEGIVKTLAACSCQTSAFNWSVLTKAVELKLRTGITTYQHSADYIRITPALMLGAIDVFYAVQTLPADRKVVISNEIGAVTLIVWAHYVLGLDVMVTGDGIKNVYFGSAPDSQVTITWTKPNATNSGDLFYPGISDDEEPEIRLLDGTGEVVLGAVLNDEHTLEIVSDDRHALLGWGTVYLERLLNTTLLTAQDDPVYVEAVSLSIALAISASARLEHDMSKPNRRGPSKPQSDPAQALPIPVQLPMWRVLTSGRILFHGLAVEEAKIQSYVEFIASEKLTEDSLPITFDAFLRRIPKAGSSLKPAHRLLRSIKYLAQITLIVSHIANIKECTDMPLRMTDDHPYMVQQIDVICSSPDAKALVQSHEPFHAVARLLSNSSFDARDDMPHFSSRLGFFLYLWSDFGWSVFLDSVGDKDPAEINPVLVQVRQGTPLNLKTGERKFYIRDGVGFAKTEYPDCYPLLRGSTYVPRSCARVPKRRELWASRRDDFESTLYFRVEPSEEWTTYTSRPLLGSPDPNLPGEPITPFECLSGYRALQTSLWQCYKTPSDFCPHARAADPHPSSKLGPEVVTLLGFSSAMEIVQDVPQRILVMLTHENPRLRWLAISKHYRGAFDGPAQRELVLRTVECCVECALLYTASLPGRWILVL